MDRTEAVEKSPAVQRVFEQGKSSCLRVLAGGRVSREAVSILIHTHTSSKFCTLFLIFFIWIDAGLASVLYLTFTDSRLWVGQPCSELQMQKVGVARRLRHGARRRGQAYYITS